MWNSVIQKIVGLIFVAALVSIIRTKNVKKRTGWSIVLGVTLVGIILLAQNRIENIFYSFPTAESVAAYACGDHVLGIVDGKDSSMIVYSDNENVIKTMITPKRESGYKIGTDIRTKWISKNLGNGVVYILEYMGIEDHYVYIMVHSDTSEISVEDRCNSKFVESKKGNVFGNVKFTNYQAFAFIEEYTEGYTVTITSGGESMTISL